MPKATECPSSRALFNVTIFRARIMDRVLLLIPVQIESTIALDGSPMPLLQSASEPISYRVKTCFNCGLENEGDVLPCAGCRTEFPGARRSEADAVLSMACDEGLHFAGVSPSWKQKPLRIHILEWFLVLFALNESGVLHLGYHFYATRWSLSINCISYSRGVYEWISYLLCNASALGILGYVLFRNSMWCQSQAAYSTGNEKAMSKPEGSSRVPIVELFLVLFVAFAESIFYSFEILVGHRTIPDEPTISSVARDVYRMLFYFLGLGLLSYVLSRSSQGFRDLGLRWTSRDVAVTLPLALGGGLAYRLLLPIAFWGAEMVSGHSPQVSNIGNYLHGTSISMAAVVCEFLNGAFEELLVRGYLMTEVRRFTGSTAFAIFCSVAVQVSYHFYQGGPQALAYVGLFLILAVYYAKTNRLLPVILAHIAIDLNSLVMYALRPT